MSDTSVPERKVLLALSLRESALIKVLREHPFGKISVSMQEGVPLRVVIEASKMLHEQDGEMMAAQETSEVTTAIAELVKT